MINLHAANWADKIGGCPFYVRLIVPVLTGAFMGLGHEPLFGLAPMFVGLAFAILVLPIKRRAASWFGWLLGVGYFAVVLRWIVEPFLVDIARHGWMAPFAILLLAGGLALFWGLAAWCARFVAGARPVGILWFAFFLTTVEFLRGHVFTGFPWGLWSYSTVGGFWDVWLAWIGPYGLSGLIALTAAGCAYGLHRAKWTALVGLVGVACVTSCLQLTTPKATQLADAPIVRVVQPNAPQHQKWDPDWMPVFYSRAIELTGGGDAVDAVIWPETSIPNLLHYSDRMVHQMSVAARGAPVVAGVQREANGEYYNSLIVIDGPSEISQIYDKAHLVPFGEFIPLASVLRPLGLGVIVDQVAGFKPGDRSGVLEIDGLGRARVLICYEGIFPEEIQTDEPRSDVLLIITNDAWFGTGPGPRQHLVQAQARAIEQGLPGIRAANTGISAVIDARGRILASLPLNESGALDAPVPAPLPPTIYAQIGDWPFLALLLWGCLRAVVARKRFTVDAEELQG